MKKADKVELVKNLTNELGSATAIVLVDYTGLTVAMQQDLKKKLSVIGARMLVAKNTLFKIAAESAKLDSGVTTDTVLSGQTALIITKEDPIAPLQVVAKFAQEFEIPNLKVGIVDGNFQDTNTLITLSKLPSKDLLSAQVVGAIAAPMYGIVGVLNANMQKLLSILKQASEKSQ
jgi:large subunit ribosomal protein L10